MFKVQPRFEKMPYDVELHCRRETWGPERPPSAHLTALNAMLVFFPLSIQVPSWKCSSLRTDGSHLSAPLAPGTGSGIKDWFQKGLPSAGQPLKWPDT